MLSKTRLSELVRKKPLGQLVFYKTSNFRTSALILPFRFSVLIKQSCVLRDPKKNGIKKISDSK